MEPIHRTQDRFVIRRDPVTIGRCIRPLRDLARFRIAKTPFQVGMPPRAEMGVAPRSSRRYSVARLDGLATLMRRPRSPPPSTSDKTNFALPMRPA